MSSRKKPSTSAPTTKSPHASALTALDKLSKDFKSEFDSGRTAVRIPTGFPSFDAVSGGGILEGRCTEAWGDESSGKTTLGAQIAPQFVAQPGDVGLVMDFEHTYMADHGEAMSGLVHVHVGELREWLSKQGKRPPPVMVWCQPSCAEDGGNLLFALSDLFKDRLRYVILDSLATMTPRVLMEKGFDEKTFAAAANFMTTFFHRATKIFAERRTSLWCCNQDRANIGATSPFAPKVKAAGARIIKFAMSQRFHFVRGEGSPYKTEIPGSHRLYVTVDKNKTSRDRRGRTRLTMWPGRGFSRETDWLDLALEYGVFKSGGPGKLQIDKNTALTTDAMLKYLTDPVQGPQIRELIRAKLAALVPDGRYVFAPPKKAADADDD